MNGDGNGRVSLRCEVLGMWKIGSGGDNAAFKGVWYGSGRRLSTAHCRVGTAVLQLRLAHGPGEGVGEQWARCGNGVLLAHDDTSEHDFAVRYDIPPGSHWGAASRRE